MQPNEPVNQGKKGVKSTNSPLCTEIRRDLQSFAHSFPIASNARTNGASGCCVGIFHLIGILYKLPTPPRMVSANSTVCSRTACRSPENCIRTTAVPLCEAHPRYTVPTGVSNVPPPGPATPVALTATSTRSTSRAPSAICRAQGSLTTPGPSSVACET